MSPQPALGGWGGLLPWMDSKDRLTEPVNQKLRADVLVLQLTQENTCTSEHVHVSVWPDWTSMQQLHVRHRTKTAGKRRQDHVGDSSRQRARATCTKQAGAVQLEKPPELRRNSDRAAMTQT